MKTTNSKRYAERVARRLRNGGTESPRVHTIEVWGDRGNGLELIETIEVKHGRRAVRP